MKIKRSQLTDVLILVASVLFVSCSEQRAEKNLKRENWISVQVESPFEEVTDEITFSGQIESKKTAILSTRVMGFISSVRVKSGDKVQKGQLLITINNTDILAKRAQAEAAISEAEAALNDAQRDYRRYEELHKKQSASTKEFETVTLRYNSVKARAEAARQMKNETDAMLDYTNIVAPFSGVITQRHFDEGSLANPGLPLLALEETNGCSVNAFVSENEVGKLKNGMKVEVNIKSTGKKMTGSISEISPSSQFTGGQFQIKINLPTSLAGELLSGMYVNVRVLLKNDLANRALFVPMSALIHRDQLLGLYTVDTNDTTAQLRWLRVGRERGQAVEVLSGLSSKEKFIVHSEGRLYNGAPVVVK